MSNDLLVEKSNGILKLIMNRPERRNAMSDEMLNDMLNELNKASFDNSIRVIVLTGAGNAFCAGGDVKDMAEKKDSGDKTTQQKTSDLRRVMETSRLLHEITTPTIAVIPGPAAGAGFSLAMACDMRIACESSKFTTAFAKVGFPGDFGGSYFLTQMIGTAKARELYYLAELMTAQKAYEIGIINKVVADNEFEDEAKKIINHVASGPSIAYRYMKTNMNVAELGDLNQSLDSEAMHQTLCRFTEDHQNATKAFIEKKQPIFKGK